MVYIFPAMFVYQQFFFPKDYDHHSPPSTLITTHFLNGKLFFKLHLSQRCCFLETKMHQSPCWIGWWHHLKKSVCVSVCVCTCSQACLQSVLKIGGVTSNNLNTKISLHYFHGGERGIIFWVAVSQAPTWWWASLCY